MPTLTLIAFLLALVAPGQQPSPRRSAPVRLTATIAASVEQVKPGVPFDVEVQAFPAAGIHVYAPGNLDYIPVQLTLAPQPGLTLGKTVFPAAEDYYFAPLNETVKVYLRPFALKTKATYKPPRGRAAGPLVIEGALDYQACDDKVCFPPTSVPLKLEVGIGK